MASGIYNLPNELLLKIFEYFSTRELCLVFRHVCMRWNDLVSSPSLWKQRMLLCDVNDLDDTIQILSEVPLLPVRKFHLKLHESCMRTCNFPARETHCECAINILRMLFRHCGTLHMLVLEGVHVNLYTVLNEYVSNSTVNNLQEIHIIGNQGFKPNIHALGGKLCGVFKVESNLRKLIIPFCRDINGADLRAIADNCPFLQELDVKNARRVYDPDLIYFLEKTKETLVVIKLDGRYLTGTFFSKLSICQKLEILSIVDCQKITNERISNIGNLPLKSLYLSGLRFTPCKLFEEKHFPQLLDLQFHECQSVNDCVAASISINCDLLQKLFLSYCKNITDIGLKTILNGCKGLKCLHIEGISSLTEYFLCATHIIELKLVLCKSVNDDVAEIISINCNSLETLSLDLCLNVTYNGVKTILRGCQHLKKLSLTRMTTSSDRYLLHIHKFSNSLEYLLTDSHVMQSVEKRLKLAKSAYKERQKKLQIKWISRHY